MNRWLVLLFGLVGYGFGMVSLTVFMLFVGGWAELPIVGELPWQIDAAASSPVGQAMLVNVLLVLLFGLQHTVMARPAFKRTWTKIVPQEIERSCYCIATGIVIWMLVLFWQPIAGTVWHVQHTGIATALTALQVLGWGTAVAASFMINHFELFGLQQTVAKWLGREVPADTFKVRSLYRFVRHPLQMGILFGIWATPLMSVSHLFMSVTMTMYILTGLYFEEQDLSASLGEDYENYRRRVPMLLPKLQSLSTEMLTQPLTRVDPQLAMTPLPVTETDTWRAE